MKQLSILVLVVASGCGGSVAPSAAEAEAARLAQIAYDRCWDYGYSEAETDVLINFQVAAVEDGYSRSDLVEINLGACEGRREPGLCLVCVSAITVSVLGL